MKLTLSLVAFASLFPSTLGQGTLTIDFEDVALGPVDGAGFQVGPMTIRRDTSNTGCTQPTIIDQESNGNKYISNDGNRSLTIAHVRESIQIWSAIKSRRICNMECDNLERCAEQNRCL